MSSTNSAQAQQKFSNLRKRLDQLGYKQTLGIESLPLVEKLFADLIHTTESLKNAKLDLSKNHTETKDVDSAIEPFKSDNARLVKENNDLHKNLIKQKEDSDAAVREFKASLRKLEHETADLKFLNNQYVHKVKQLEKEAKSKTERILQLQEKNFHAVVQTPGGKKKNIPFRRQRMEIDTTVPPAEGSVPVYCPSDDPYVADLLQVADARIADLESQLRTIKDENEIFDRKVKNFRQQVEGRDEEIDRLNRMLDGGRPTDVVALEARNRANERMISHLNIQVDFLEQQKRDLERKLQDSSSGHIHAESRMKELQARNRDLEYELKNVDRMAQRLQSDKEIVVKTADKEMWEAKGELEKSRLDLEDMDLTFAQCKAQNKALVKELSDSKAKLAVKQGEVLKLDEILDRLQDDKKRLSNRVNKLTVNEKELVLEIERLKRKNGPLGTSKKSKATSKLDAFIKTIEEERNYYRDQSDAFQKLLRERPARSRSPVRSRPTSPSPLKTDKKTISQYETIIRVLEEEKDYYRKEYEGMKAIKKGLSSAKSTPTKAVADKSEILKLTHERDEMRSLLDKFERHMAEIQANVKVLTGERDKLNIMYDEANSELQKLRREMVQSPKSPKTSLAAQAVLRRIENERDDVVADLRRICTERDSLRERLKIATETALSDRAKLEQRLEDVQVDLHTSEAERNELIARFNTLKEEVRSLEEQVKDQAFRISDTQDDASQQRSNATQMKLLAQESEKSLDDTQRRLRSKENELHAVEERCLTLEERIAEMQRVNQLTKDEISQARTTISCLDREKDSIQSAVDEKTEKVANLHEDLLQKEKYISELKIRVGELEAQLEHANDSFNLKDRELKSMRRQLDSTTEDLNETSRSKDIACRENRRLQDDLAVMTRESQKLNQELQDALEDRENLKTQIQEYIVEVKNTEDLLRTKEDERSDLLEQYRTLTMEAEQFQTSNHQLESEKSNLRLELMTKDSELRRYKDRTENMEREIQEHCGSQQAYELQLSSLTRSVANLEEGLRQLEHEKQDLLADNSAVRELCSRLEATKEGLQRQLSAASLDKEQLNCIIDDMKQETELLKTQVNAERDSGKNLEGLLQNNREKEFQSQLSAQEKSAEIQLLRDRLSLNESKIQSQSREIASLRTHNVELEGDVERLRRQLTSERFERERAVQELRRNGINPPIADYSLTRSISPGRSRSRSRTPPRRSHSPDTSYLSSSVRRRSPERSSYYEETISKSYTSNQDII